MKKVLFMGVIGLFLLTGCYELTGGIILDSGHRYGHSNPPAHAPAHGLRAHRYHYYPNAEFYFDIGSNMYYFLDSGAQWTFSVNLPIRLRHHLHNNYVEIEMNDERPYRKHKYYRNKYKKHRTKYRRKYDNNRLHDGSRKRKYDSQRLDDGTRNGRKNKYDSRRLDENSQDKRKYKKKNRKYRDEDEEENRSSNGLKDNRYKQ